ncbi:hypothetical protein [uncultured Cohaesibacter sp.]|uniref:hypothetical protein n=1 Tax=uncultured Cohaesibacter sp. TaxID=1002546 RepID=UPI00293022FD|nr:hypothetical protein [uncultured Cohaesibacter sp.]
MPDYVHMLICTLIGANEAVWSRNVSTDRASRLMRNVFSSNTEAVCDYPVNFGGGQAGDWVVTGHIGQFDFRKKITLVNALFYLIQTILYLLRF